MESCMVHFQVMVHVHVVQVEKRQNTGISSGSWEMGAQVGQVKLGRQCLSDQAVGPFVEVAQHDARAGYVDRSQQIFIHQANSLLLALAMRSAKVNVEDMYQMLPNANVGAQDAAFFAARDGQVNLSDQSKIESAERHIAIDPATMFASFADGVNIPEIGRQIAGLMILNRFTLVVHYFLESNDISVQLSQDAPNALDARAAIEPPSFVNVVGCDAESGPEHWLYLVLDE